MQRFSAGLKHDGKRWNQHNQKPDKYLNREKKPEKKPRVKYLRRPVTREGIVSARYKPNPRP